MTFTASRTNAGSIVTPKPGPEGTRTTPFSHLQRRGLAADGDVGVPLNSVNGTGFGMHETKCAASR